MNPYGKEEKLPQVVEDRLLEAYGKIREGKVTQMNKKTRTYHRWTGAAAACAVLLLGSAGAIAAASYFQKELHQEADTTVYEFSLNYELIPGEYKVTPSYLPEGLEDQGDGKYYGEDGLGITIMPVYTTAELDRLNGEIALTGDTDQVEHTTLSGMEADIITYKEAEKYQSPTEVYLFDSVKGCVIHLHSCYPVGQEELRKFADSLTVERVGDAAFETAGEKEARQQEEAETEQRFLKVDLKAHCYENSVWDEIPLDFQLVYVDRTSDGGLTWSLETYDSVPQENYQLQMDHSAVYLDQAENTDGEARKSFFFAPVETGEDLTYTLLFVVDRDREEDFVLAPTGFNMSFQQTENESAEQILEELDGYVRLQ